MRRRDPSSKALIFSQYNSTIEWLKQRLTQEGERRRANPPAKPKCTGTGPSPSVPHHQMLMLLSSPDLLPSGFGYRFISGAMPLNQRTRAIDAFQKDPPTTVRHRRPHAGSFLSCPHPGPLLTKKRGPQPP